MFGSVLIANRGEIALRVLRSCRDLGIRSVVAHSAEDRRAAFVQLADEAVELPAASGASPYLNLEGIIAAARRTGVDAIHPGYGFLSEDPRFPAACGEAGLVFVGPPEQAIAAMGDKLAARRLMARSGVPVIPGGEVEGGVEEAVAAAERIGYPVLIKASAGGGGIGMRIAADEASLRAGLAGARSAAERAFGDGTVFLERFVAEARHVEIQVLVDARGSAVQLGERECSVQRRFQKLVEETPSPVVDDALRERMGSAALEAARAIGYRNAGTVEFVLAGKDFYFLEMNTRLQVEHPITELVYGVDLVAEQLRLAAGEPLSLDQAAVVRRGHAIECRVCAEDPAAGFVPSPGRVSAYREPSGPGIRVDSALTGPAMVSASYDPMIAKVIAWGADREQARARMMRALLEFAVVGIVTNIPFLLAVLDSPGFRSGAYSTRFVDEHPELMLEVGRWRAAGVALQRGLGGDGARVAAIAAAVTMAGS